MTTTRNQSGGCGDERLDAAVAHLVGTEPQLPIDRLIHHQESIMRQITDDVSLDRHRGWASRRRVLLGAAMVALASVSVAGPAAAGQLEEWLHHAPVTTRDAERMQVFYQGQRYTWVQIAALQTQGRAMVTVEEPRSYAQGQAYAFDTPADADHWACQHVGETGRRPACPASGG